MRDINRIMEMMPHRYPFLLVDRVLDFEKDKSIVGIKNVTISEPYFTGHFPGFPVMPGVLMLEALAQISGLLLIVSSDLTQYPEDRRFFLVGVDNSRIRRMVVPGDQLRLRAELTRQSRHLTRFEARAEVEGQLACQAALTISQQK